MLLEQYGFALGIEEDSSPEIFYFYNFPTYTVEDLVLNNAIISLYYNSTTLADLAAVWEEHDQTKATLRFDSYFPFSKIGRHAEEKITPLSLDAITLFLNFVKSQATLNEVHELTHKINSYVSK